MPRRDLLLDRIDAALRQAQHDSCFVALLVMGDFDSGTNPRGAVDLSDLAQRLEPLMRPDDTVARGPGDSTLVVVCHRIACAVDGEMIAARLVSKLLPIVCRVRSTFSGADRDADLLLARAFRHWVLDQERRAYAAHN
jgi:GGDEF domain-containing protein